MFLHDKEESAANFLMRQLGAMQQSIAKIPAERIGKNTDALTTEYIDKYIVKPIEVEKPVSKIDPDKPTSVVVNWKIKGTIALIGLSDADGMSVDLKKNSQTAIIQSLNYQASIAGNDKLQHEIKQTIIRLTTDINNHVGKLNEAVSDFNKEVRTAIPSFVSERVKEINRLRAAEDFLNS
jgi:hypothetical protein